MEERACPDDPGFRDRWVFHRYKKIIPVIALKRSPYRREFFWRYNWVKRYCRGQDVLDIPCGMGWGASMLRHSKSIVGVDIYPDAIYEARRRYGNVAHFHIGDMKKLDFANNSFDVVVCLEGIEHVSADVGQSFLKEVNRILKPSGKLFLSSPHCRAGGHSGNKFHIHEYQPDEIKELTTRYFEIEKVLVRGVDKMVVHYFQARKTE